MTRERGPRRRVCSPGGTTRAPGDGPAGPGRRTARAPGATGECACRYPRPGSHLSLSLLRATPADGQPVYHHLTRWQHGHEVDLRLVRVRTAPAAGHHVARWLVGGIREPFPPLFEHRGL